MKKKMKDKNNHLRRNLNVSTKEAKQMKSGYADILAVCIANAITHFMQLKTQQD